MFHATFAAETGAALEAIGLGKYLRAYYCDIMLGGAAQPLAVAEYGEEHVPLVLYTDCRSLFGHLAKDGSVPEDRWTAVAVAALRCAVSSGPGRNEEKPSAVGSRAGGSWPTA